MQATIATYYGDLKDCLDIDGITNNRLTTLLELSVKKLEPRAQYTVERRGSDKIYSKVFWRLTPQLIAHLL